MADGEQENSERGDADNVKSDKLFTLKKWNAVAMWSWDVECDTCAICRVQVMGEWHFLKILNITSMSILSYKVEKSEWHLLLGCISHNRATEN